MFSISATGFEIGGIFLLVAMLMYGTKSGFLPKVFGAGKPASLVAAIAAIALSIYFFGPRIASAWGSISLTLWTPASTAPESPTPAPAAARPRNATRPRITVIEAPSPAPAPTVTSAQSEAAPMTQQSDPRKSESTNSDTSNETNSREGSGNSLYDSGVKRGLKKVGRFLHITKRTDQ